MTAGAPPHPVRPVPPGSTACCPAARHEGAGRRDEGDAMPVSKPADLPVGGGGRWPLCGVGFRSAQWGDMEVGYTTAGPMDCTPVYASLPGGVCQCPHYGYVFTGRLRA